MSIDLPVLETVICHQKNQVVQITPNRPKRRNALNDALLRDLLAAFNWAEEDETIRAVVLTEAGKGFCAEPTWPAPLSTRPGSSCNPFSATITWKGWQHFQSGENQILPVVE